MKLNFKNILFLLGVFVFAFGFLGISNAKAANLVSSSFYRDLNGDGKIDSILINMDENVTSCVFEEADWAISVAGDIGLSDITNINCLGTDNQLFVEVISDNFVTGGLVAPVITYTQATGTADSVTLTSGAMTDKSLTLTDSAGPVIDETNSAYLDVDEDGTVDSVKIAVYPDIGLDCGTFTAGTDFVINTAGTVNLTESLTDACSTNGTDEFIITLGAEGETGLTGGDIDPVFSYFQPEPGNDGFQDGEGNWLTVYFDPTPEAAQTEYTLSDGASPMMVSVVLSDYSLGRGDTATVTFTATEALAGFTKDDVTTPNGVLSDITGDSGVYTATFTPTSGISDNSNIMTVGTSYTDESLNPSVGGSIDSLNYQISTRTSSGSSGSVARPAIPATHETPADCLPGFRFSPSTGRNCNAATPAIPAVPAQQNWQNQNQNQHVVQQGPGRGYAFGQTLVKQGTMGEACRAWQAFFNEKFGANLAVDGICGKLTIATAKAWQKAKGLSADGLLGPASRGKAMLDLDQDDSE